MYEILLSTTFDEARGEHTRDVISSNSTRLITTFTTKNHTFNAYSTNSDVMVLYDAYARKPIIVIERIPIEEASVDDVKNKVMQGLDCDKYTVNASKSSDSEYIDLTIVRRDAYEALTAEA